MSIFADYAQFYDLLYQDKDYAAEQRYVQRLIEAEAIEARRILDLGCGTGGHAQLFASQGLQVDGIDLSENMLIVAENKRQALPAAVADRLDYRQGDVRTIRLGRTYDVVLSLFHVASYQTSDADIAAFFETARRHCNDKGLFIFDLWYGPAVLKEPPAGRRKVIHTEQGTVHRHTAASMDMDSHLIQVDFTLQQFINDRAKADAIKETHTMRYYFRDELEDLLNQAGMKMKRCYRWMTCEPATAAAWYAVVIAQPL